MLGQYNGPDSDDEDDEEEEKEEEIDSNKVQYMDTDEEETPLTQSSDQLLINSSNSLQIKEIIGFGSDSNDSNDDHDKNDAIYDAETDSESNTEAVDNSQEKESVSFGTDKALDIFKDKYFHFYGPFDDKEKQTLTQYIIAYKGFVLLIIIYLFQNSLFVFIDNQLFMI